MSLQQKTTLRSLFFDRRERFHFPGSRFLGVNGVAVAGFNPKRLPCFLTGEYDDKLWIIIKRGWL